MLWALATDAGEWDAIAADDALLAAAIMGYVRYDISVQEIAKEIGTGLEVRDGAGLEKMALQRPATTTVGAAKRATKHRQRSA